MRRLELKIPSDPAFLTIMRQVTSAVGAMAGLSPEEVNAVVLAVDEACTNVIKHAYKYDYSQHMVLNCELRSDRLELRLRDFGAKCDLSRIRSRDLDDVKPGGLGVHIINEVMDEVEYDTRHAVGTELKMTKFLKPAGLTDSTGSTRSPSHPARPEQSRRERSEGVKADGS